MTVRFGTAVSASKGTVPEPAATRLKRRLSAYGDETLRVRIAREDRHGLLEATVTAACPDWVQRRHIVSQKQTPAVDGAKPEPVWKFMWRVAREAKAFARKNRVKKV